MIPDQHKAKATWAAICCSTLVSVEGMKTVPYFDVGDTPTACVGETQGVKMTDRYTPEQCLQMLDVRVQRDYGPGVDHCLRGKPLPPARKAAYTSFAYNAGVHRFCESPMVRYETSNNPAAACEAMRTYIVKYRKLGVLVDSPGLLNRRRVEANLCAKDLT